MKPAEFTLKSVFYPDLSVRANPEFSYESENTPSLPAAQIQVFKDEGGLYRIALNLKKTAESDCDPYDVTALAFGVFKADQRLSQDDQLDVIMFSGPSILYGSLRDHIASVTARGPWSEYYLPPVILDHDDFITEDASSDPEVD